jgi:6-phosphogluconolactonase
MPSYVHDYERGAFIRTISVRQHWRIKLIWASVLVLLLGSTEWLARAKEMPSDTYLMFVGTYTNTKGESKGIYAYRYDSASGHATSLGLAAETINPSFLAIDPRGSFLYAVNELTSYKGASSGAISSFAIDHQNGTLRQLNEVASRGADPCYISFDKTGKYVLVANYTGGSVAVFPVSTDGSLGEPTAFIQHSGKGVNPQRQEGPHAHWIETTADNRFAIVADLGLDELLVYRFDPARGTLTPNTPPFARTEAGSGPRHVAFRPDGKFAYLITEMHSDVFAFSYNAAAGLLHQIQKISALPKGFSGSNDAAEIHVHPNGKFLYVSNRGDDSIATFSIDKKTGRLSLIGHFSTQGKTPRNFVIDPTGSRLAVANQDSDSIVIFQIDRASGRLSPSGQRLHVPSPVSIVFLKDSGQ